MIPDIGLMIGAYIFTRMADLANTSSSKVIRVLAALTMFLTVAMMADLAMRGTIDIGLGDLAR
jgi:hypothetical protein